MYLQACKENQLVPHPRCLPKPKKASPSDGSTQTNLDGFVEATPSVKWSRQGLLEHILDFVVSDDQVIKSYFIILIFYWYKS